MKATLREITRKKAKEAKAWEAKVREWAEDWNVEPAAMRDLLTRL